MTTTAFPLRSIHWLLSIVIVIVAAPGGRGHRRAPPGPVVRHGRPALRRRAVVRLGRGAGRVRRAGVLHRVVRSPRARSDLACAAVPGEVCRPYFDPPPKGQEHVGVRALPG